MDFLSLSFYLFCPLFFLGYYTVPVKYRYVVIFVGSYFFYGFGNPALLVFLVATTLITYLGGLIIAKYPCKKVLLSAFSLNIAILFVFKYTNFFMQNLQYAIKDMNGGV